MIPKISDIFQQKLNEIQSRVPVKIRGSSYSVPFEKYLSDAVDGAANAAETITDPSDTTAADPASSDDQGISSSAKTTGLPDSLQRALKALAAYKSNNVLEKTYINAAIEKAIMRAREDNGCQPSELSSNRSQTTIHTLSWAAGADAQMSGQLTRLSRKAYRGKYRFMNQWPEISL